MEYRTCSVSRGVQAVLALVLAAVGPTWAGNRHDLSFTYSVTPDVVSGPLVQVSVRMSLTNRGQDSVSVQRVVFRHLHAADQAKPFSPITVQAHSSQQVIQHLMLSRAEFERWQRDMGPKILLQIQSANKNLLQVVMPDKLPSER